MTDMNPFPTWLLERMRERGGHRYRAANLARESGIAKATISAWLDGRSEPERASIERLAVVFGVPTTEIYTVLGREAPDVSAVQLVREQIIAIAYQLSEAEAKVVLRELRSKYGGGKSDSR